MVAWRMSNHRIIGKGMETCFKKRILKGLKLLYVALFM